ncbi:hypothetical protein FDG2_3253 [Candidatus Protofrankia californiensis]|uniref:Uncharacterized protein n=1 Tax=Candidatus Protofrankia californiensis TaxID=1839754 RepID=A0A1C3NZ79_9ACTN|nr:hypothetical protein FDG2_3253 [Candidatus Protofrankia californiensis]
MHTSQLVDRGHFRISVDGSPGARENLFPEWGPLDRFGVVVHEAFGSIGCSYLLQLAISSFYDVRPERRNRTHPIYPDIFVFHVGGYFGDHTYFDVFPPRKEVFLPNNPAAILNAVNDRGITYLAVPDRLPDHVQHDYKEPQQAIDRIRGAWAYAAGGRASSPNIEVTAIHELAEANTRISLDPEGAERERREAHRITAEAVVPADEIVQAASSRASEISADQRIELQRRRAALDSTQGRSEAYRRIPIRDALGMLHRGLISEVEH